MKKHVYDDERAKRVKGITLIALVITKLVPTA